MTPDASLGRTLLQQLRRDRRDALTRVLAVVEDLTDEQLGRRLVLVLLPLASTSGTSRGGRITTAA